MDRQKAIEKILKLYNLECNSKNIYHFGKYNLEIYNQWRDTFCAIIYNSDTTMYITFEMIENCLGLYSNALIRVNGINTYCLSINKNGYIYTISKGNETVSLGVNKDSGAIITAKHEIKSKREDNPFDLYMRLKEGNGGSEEKGYDFDLLYITENTKLAKPFSNNLNDRIKGCNFSKMNEIINIYDKRYYEFIKEAINYFQNEDMNILLPIFDMCYNKYEDSEIEAILGIEKPKIKELVK